MPDESKIIKLGIIGCGRVAEERHLPALKMLDKIKIVAISDVDSDRMQKVGGQLRVENQFADYRELIDCQGVEAVGVLTPTTSHAEISTAVLEANKHLLLEKPMAMNMDECDQLIEKSHQSSCKVLLGFNLRWHRLVQQARKFIKSGAMGNIKAINSVYTHYRLGQYAPDWHRKFALGGGVAFNEAVHHFDLWRYFTDSQIEKVSSFNRPSVYYEDETHVTSASLSNGTLATGIFTFQTSPTSEVEIYGDKGRLHLSMYRFDGLNFFPYSIYPGDIFDRFKKLLFTFQQLPQAIQALRLGGDFASTFYYLWQHFIDCINNNTAPGCTLEDGKQAVLASLATMESAKTKKSAIVQPKNR